ncbi:hypothetical protein HY256_03160 [Candidatus Sumerlaeota bacterium]|nr:hypothetical protein [Candidatus Sumerlaeota bacterium]
MTATATALPTPMVRHYLRVKSEHPDEILLYRIGDFYETFGEDAQEASRILNITLTKKHIGNGRTLPLACIPYHTLDNYLAKLIRARRRVAICDQTADKNDNFLASVAPVSGFNPVSLSPSSRSVADAYLRCE